jgi:16S rRNA G966 N2-methylase RsmD
MAKTNWFDLNYYLPTSGRPATIDPTREGVHARTSPFAHRISIAGKGGRAYNTHSYPTKVPPEAIVPYIEYYTNPGDVVLDPFCGSGMTGLAARRCQRHSVLSDLSPLAIHIAFNQSNACDGVQLKHEWGKIKATLETQIAAIYGIKCGACSRRAITRYVVWSDVYACPRCDGEVPLWRHGVDRRAGKVSRKLSCPHCKHKWNKTAASRSRIEPAWAAYDCVCASKLQERDLTPFERKRYLEYKAPRNNLYVPRFRMVATGEMFKRSALHLQNVRTVADFYTRRNLYALALIWDAINGVANARVRHALAFAFTNTAWHGTRMRRFNSRGGHRPLSGTLYIPQLSSEANVFDVFDNKINHLVRYYSEVPPSPFTPNLRLGSATDLRWIPDGSVDYVFTDPPFGSNIFYADCNVIGEAWLGARTDDSLEAVVNRSRTTADGGKTLSDYRALLYLAFKEMHRVLKPGHWATIVFQSTDGSVWDVVQSAAAKAGFDIASSNVLDKVQQSMKGYKGRSGVENVASFDIVLNLKKSPRARGAPPRSLGEKQLEEAVRDAVGTLFHSAESNGSVGFSLPLLYSSVLVRLLDAQKGIKGLTMDQLRTILAKSPFQEREGLWYATKNNGAPVLPNGSVMSRKQHR